MLSAFLAAAVAFAVAAGITPVVRAAARRIGAVAQPKSDRWHSKPTAMLGGVAIFIAVIGTLLVLVPKTKESWVVIACSSALFVVGLVDDFVRIKPYQKLVGQLLASSVVVYLGLVLPWTGSFVLNMIITFVWLVGVTNAVNMLDNMDGLSAGVSGIAAIFLAANFILNGQPVEALTLAVFAAALVGFLIYNHNPASIFMGDCGSMFIGFFLASTALLAADAGGGRSRSVLSVLAVPVLVLCIPIFDTTFVTIMRKLAGRSASQGGRDHTSHRLVALGLSERQAVWMLYAFATAAGVLSLAARRLQIDVSVAVIAVFAVLLAFIGVYLAGVKVYSAEEIATSRQRPIVAFLFDLSYKRRIFEVALDVILIVLAYYGAYAMLFGPARMASGDWQLFLRTLPVIVFIKLGTFLAAGVYRGLWRYAGVSDVVRYSRAVFLASVLCVLVVVLAFRFEGFSRAAFFLDGMFLLILLNASRFAFRLIRRLLPIPHARTARRALIFGAGDGGELAWRELRNNGDLQYVPVAFADDDPDKIGKFIHGLRVHSGQNLAELCREKRIDEVFLSTSNLRRERLLGIVASCAAAGVAVSRVRIVIEPVPDSDLAWITSTTDGAQPIDLAAPPLLKPRPSATRLQPEH